MPYYVAPTNDVEKHAFLNTVLDTAKKDMDKGNIYMNQQTVDAIEALLPEYTQAISDVQSKLGARSKEVLEGNEALSKLELYIRDMWDGLRRRTIRMNHPAKILTEYGLPLNGLTPRPNRNSEWLTIGATIIKGEANAIAEGFPPISNPSVEELQAVLETAGKETGEAAIADRVYDEAQEALAVLRVKVDALVGKTRRDLEYFLFDRDDASRRRIMRTYGIKFKYLPDEPQEEDDTLTDES